MWNDLEIPVDLEKKNKTRFFLVVSRKSDSFPEISKVQEKDFSLLLWMHEFVSKF